MNPFTKKTRIAFLGLGAMGTRMVQRLVDAGVAPTVWSRSPGDTPAGAARVPSIAEAVGDAEVVFSMVRDDDASRAVWLGPAGALAHVGRGTVVIECSTLSPAWVTELAEAASEMGAPLLDAPVVGSRPQAEAGILAFLVGGPTDVVDAVRPVLELMGNAVHALGASGAGATAKLLVNALFGIQVAALAELFGVAHAAHLDTERFAAALDALPVMSPAAKGAAASMQAQKFAPMFPIDLVTKDLRYLVQTATAHGSRTPLSAAARETFEEGERQHLGDENLTAIAKLYRSTK